MRSASRAAESSALSRLIPEEDGEEAEAMGEEAEAIPWLESCDLQGPCRDQWMVKIQVHRPRDEF